ncbi:MAG: uroporphyrinogen-III synthase [Bacteroidota bacterium]
MNISKTILSGKHIVLTRALHQNAKFTNDLIALGAIPIIFPTIEIKTIADIALIDKAISNIRDYTFIIFTSANAAELFMMRYRFVIGNIILPNEIKTIAVGKSTAGVLASFGIENSKVPEAFMSKEIPAILGDITGNKILIPCSELAKEDLKLNLENKGAEVHSIAIYDNQIPESIDHSILDQPIDYLTFTSPSTVVGWIKIIADSKFILPDYTCIVAIGEITADAAKSVGLKVDVIAKEHTTEGMISAMIYYENAILATNNVQ